MANTIDSIFAFGEDALANLFEVSIVKLPLDLENANKLNLDYLKGRITAINIPGKSIGSYDRHYKTQVVPLPTGKIEQSKEFNFTLRVDKEFGFYELLSTWCDLANSSGQYMWSGESKHYLGTLSISRCGNNLEMADSGRNMGWTFHHVWIKSVGDISFDWSSGEPLDAEITCCYSWVETISGSSTATTTTPTPVS